MTPKRTQTERVAAALVKYVEAHPMCSRFEATASIPAKCSTIYPWEMVKHLFDLHKNGKSVKYTRTKEAYSLKETPRRPAYKGVSDQTKSVSSRIEALLKTGKSYAGHEIRKRLKISVSVYKQAIAQADVARYTIKGNGYLYAQAGTFDLPEAITDVEKVSQTILGKIESEPNISATQLREDLKLDIITFRCAMKHIIHKVEKNIVNFKIHYHLKGAERTEIAIKNHAAKLYSGEMLTQWRGGNPFARMMT